MKLAKIKINNLGVQSVKGRINDFVKNIEFDGKSIYRITFKDLELPAYITKVDTEEPQAMHYCEQNEKGVVCAHLNIIAFICDQCNSTIEKFTIKGTVKEMQDLDTEYSKLNFTNVNRDFGLLELVDEEDETETAPSTNETPTPATALTTKRDWKKGWNAIQNYLVDEGVSTQIVYRIEERRQEIAATVPLHEMMVAPQKPHFPYHGPMLNRALRHVVALNKDLILIGDKGTGKDTLINTIAWILGLPTVLQIGNKDVTKESIMGEPSFRNGESTFDLSLLATAVKDGGIANFAEVNMLVGDVTSILHPLADENQQLPTPIGSIERNKNFIMIGSMNVGSGYSGIRPLNDAFKDRFAILRLPVVQDFEEMLRSKTGLHDSHGLTFLKQVKGAVDKMIQEENQGHAASTVRGYVDAARYFLQIGINKETKVEVIEDYIINKVEDVEEYMAIRDIIRSEAWTDFPISEEEQQFIDGEI